MNRGFFLRPSLSIELDADYFAFDDDFLYGPGKFDNPTLRVYMHEVLHFWQALSQSFLTRLALEEWERLLDYEENGTIAQGKDFVDTFKEKHSQLGFSAWDLSEALCRYWDIHILGPVKLLEQNEKTKEFLRFLPQARQYLMREVNGVREYSSFAFDLLMRAEDSYAEPYRFALEQWGTNDSVILFPIVGYFALQSPRPVQVFADAIEHVRRSLHLDRMRNLLIHDVWPEVFSRVRDVCSESCSQLCGGQKLEAGWDFMQRSMLADNPVYSHFLELLRSTARHWGPEIPNSINYCFALPGDPDNRERLAHSFRPPVTIFHDGRWTGETTLTFAARVFGSVEKVLDENVLGDYSEDIHNRFRKLRQAEIIARIASAPARTSIRGETGSMWLSNKRMADAAEALFNRGKSLHESNERGEKEAYLQSIELSKKSRTGKGKEMAARAKTSLGVLLGEEGDDEGAQQAYRDAIELGRESWTDEAKETASLAARNLGVRLERNWDQEGAKDAYLQAIELGRISRTSRGKEYAAGAAVNLGVMLRDSGDFDGSVSACSRAIELGSESETAEGKQHGARAAYIIGHMFKENGDDNKSGDYYRAAIKLGRESGTPEGKEDAASAYTDLGFILLGRDEELAIEAFQNAVELGGDGGTAIGLEDAARASVTLGALFGKRGDKEGARRALQQAIHFGQQSGTSRGNDSVARANFNLGFMLQSEDKEYATGAFLQAIEIGNKIGSEEGKQVAAMSALGLGNILRNSNDREGAKQAYQQAVGLGQESGTAKGKEVAAFAAFELERL